MLKGINLSLILDLKQPRKLNLCGNCDFNKQITFAILYERPCTLPNPAQPYPTLPSPTQPYSTLPNLTQPPFPPPELNWQGVYFSSSLWQRCLKLHCLLASLANKWWTNFESEYTLGREHVGASGRLPVREGSSLRPLSASRPSASWIHRSASCLSYQNSIFILQNIHPW